MSLLFFNFLSLFSYLLVPTVYIDANYESAHRVFLNLYSLLCYMSQDKQQQQQWHYNLSILALHLVLVFIFFNFQNCLIHSKQNYFYKLNLCIKLGMLNAVFVSSIFYWNCLTIFLINLY